MNQLNVYLLMVGAFLAVTAELILAGVLHLIATDLRVSIPLAGQLVTAYALAFAIGAPVVITLTMRYDRKKVILISFLIFILANLIALWSPNFALLMLSRVLLGVSGGVYTVVAMGSVAKLVPKEKLGNAIGTFMLGLSGALVFGVPLGVVISDWLGWKMAFGLLAAIGIIVFLGIARIILNIPGEEVLPFKQQLIVFKNSKLVSGYFVTLFWGAGYSAAYTFIAPYLQKSVEMNTQTISLTLFVLGLFSMFGTRLGGYGTDRWGISKTVMYSLAIHALALFILPLAQFTVIMTVIILAIWVGSAWVTSPTLQAYFIQQTPYSPDLSLSINTSILQIGFAIGAGLVGLVVSSTGTVISAPLVGGSIVILGIIAALVSFRLKTSSHGGASS